MSWLALAGPRRHEPTSRFTKKHPPWICLSCVSCLSAPIYLSHRSSHPPRRLHCWLPTVAPHPPRCSWFSPYLLACYDPDTEQLQSVCRCMSGFTDAFYRESKERWAVVAGLGWAGLWWRGGSAGHWLAGGKRKVACHALRHLQAVPDHHPGSQAVLQHRLCLLPLGASGHTLFQSLSAWVASC